MNMDSIMPFTFPFQQQISSLIAKATPPVRLSLPSSSLFKFPPDSVPTTVPTPSSDFTYAPAFDIPAKIYNHLLHPAYPVTFALLYLTAVSYLNRINRERGNKPWSFTKSKLFLLAVVLHNILLALFSGWTFKGMLQAVSHSWPGWPGEHGLAGTVDALCKIHGPRGLGNGVAYNTTTNIWTAPNVAINLTPQGAPDPTDLGRIWNEGLGFYGWLFYLSKFYEVLDTAIMLAKGKTPSTLQTFHHAGALVSLWAGIRHMSPPIWMWVLANAGIHTVMYTYYALKALSVPVPQWIKRLITTSQILQFIVGATFAAAHLFIHYAVPVSIPYTVTPSISSVVSAASSVASTAATSVATAASSAGIGNIIRKIALRAAGEEGLAENVALKNEDALKHSASPFEKVKEMAKDMAKPEIRYTTEEQMIPCIDTSGQAFAIWLNLLYLAPLTYLFIRFWTRSYTKRTSPETPHPTRASVLQKVTRDAVKGVERELKEEPLPLPEQTEGVAKMARETAEKVVTGLEKEAMNASHLGEGAGPKEAGEDLKEIIENMVNGAGSKNGPRNEHKQDKENAVNGDLKKEGEPSEDAMKDGVSNGEPQNEEDKEEGKDAPQDDILSQPQDLPNSNEDQDTAPEGESTDANPSNLTPNNNPSQQSDDNKGENPNRSLILAESEEDKQMVVVDPEHSTINRKD